MDLNDKTLINKQHFFQKIINSFQNSDIKLIVKVIFGLLQNRHLNFF